MNPIHNASNSEKEIELLYCIALSMYDQYSDKQKLSQLHYYGSASVVYQCRNHQKKDWPLSKAEDELKFIEKHGIECFSIVDKFYPNRLATINDPPNVLYVKGSSHFNLPYLISIVGTRQHTYQVKKVVFELLEGLNHLKMGVISGMALGVDGLAHMASLENNLSTWGVLAHGLDTIYPNQHRKLAIDILKNEGGLLTECRKNTPAMTFQFPKRNRIVAGMSDATIVIESEVKGGSMITAHLASGYHREVFAVPGKIHDTKSKGCLWLIKNNIATMYYDPIQLLEDMNWPQKPESEPILSPLKQKEISQKIDNPKAAAIYLLIESLGPIHVDEIAQKMEMAPTLLAAFLLELELNGHIYPKAANYYCCT